MKLIESNFLVISDYNWLPQNLEESWVHKYSDNYLIYDRAHRWEDSERTKRQVNVGQNIYDMFDFMATHYDNLPDVMVFGRAAMIFPKGRQKPLSNGTISEEKFLQLANNKTLTELHDFGPEVHNGHSSRYGPDGSYLEINNSWYFNHHQGRYFYNLNTFLRDVYINPEIPEYIRFAPGGSYIVPKENVLKYSKNFWEKMRTYVGWDVLTGEAHMMERSLYTILSCNWEVKENYK